jgi:mono/diheme cytochrome c family protein
LAAPEKGNPLPHRCRPSRTIRASAALAALALATPPAAAETFSTERGRALAQEWCARCHAVTAAQERPGESDVPPFSRIAADPRWTRATLIDMMTVPHLRMPPPVLALDEAAEVAAYILSLRK